MLIRPMRPIVALFALCSTAAWLHAAGPLFWQVSTEPDFLRGEFEQLTVDTFGRLALGPAATVVYEANSPFIWTVVAAGDGTIYAGSGDEGQVYRIDPAGRASVVYDAAELTVNALALAPDGALYVGTSPDGRIVRVAPDGTSAVFFDPDERYIWSLAVDAAGTVFAGTGDNGVIYRITRDGQGAPFYRTRATHAMSLVFDAEGRLLAGTESPGRVFRFDADGRPFVLLEAGYNEIYRLRADRNGLVYAAAIGSRGGTQGREPARPATADPPATSSSSAPSASVSVTVSTEVSAQAESSSGSSTQAQTAARGAGAVLRIQPDGVWDVIWESNADTPYDVAVEPGGGVVVATGNQGKIFRLEGDPHRPTMIARAAAQQVTSLLSGPSGDLLFATSNPGKVYRLSPARASRGLYTSEVRDALTVAAWGVIRWESQTPPGTRISLATRAGNTRTPDETWSDWSPAYSTPSGSAIASPRARYLQWRAELAGSSSASPVLTSVTAAYLPRNIRPRVTAITIYPPGTVFQRPVPIDPDIAGFDGDLPERRLAAQSQAGSGTTLSLGRRVYQKGLLTVAWRADDENRDDLTYDVLYRSEGDEVWKALRGDLTEPLLVWDTTSVPDGRYVLRVVASDMLSNAPERALTGSIESAAFDIDNTPPALTVRSVRGEASRTVIAFEARDEHSPIVRAEYSLDGNRWQVVHPRDGIADSPQEAFELVLEGGLAARGVILRATDALNNVATQDIR